MNLLIHDLSSEGWEAVKNDYSGWDIISDNGRIRPCAGCFCCWQKTPGRCVLKDGYENMGAAIHHAEAVTVISRYTCGGFSGFVKNVFDRSLGYVLPQFEIVGGESHHRKRYPEDKPFTFIFYGSALSEEEKESARRYVKAVCTNIRGFVKEVIFREQEDSPTVFRTEDRKDINKNGINKNGNTGKIILLNGSMRSESGNSAALAFRLNDRLRQPGETVYLKPYVGRLPDILPVLEDADTLVLCIPLYVDGLPSQVIRLMEMMQEKYQGTSKRVYLLANMGLYESRQLVNLFEAVRQWCGKMNFDYCGGLGVSAGEMVGVLIRKMPFEKGITKKNAAGMDRLADAVDSGAKIGDLYTEPWHFPRRLYNFIANEGWNRTVKANGLKRKDLYRRL